MGARSEEKKRRKNMCSRRRRSRKIGRERVGGGAHQIFVAHSDAHTLWFSTIEAGDSCCPSHDGTGKRERQMGGGERKRLLGFRKKEGPWKLLQCNGVFSRSDDRRRRVSVCAQESVFVLTRRRRRGPYYHYQTRVCKKEGRV